MKLPRLGRPSKHRRALMRNLVTALVKHERIRTTLPKAKAMRPVVDRVIRYAKKGTLESNRRAGAFLFEREATAKLITEIAPRYATRQGGYTRVLRTGFRTGDRAPMAVIEFVDREGELRTSRPPSTHTRKGKERVQPNVHADLLTDTYGAEFADA